jgi:ABC-type cobalamin/Fe3+-siderophores transport system ATPase subunit
MRLDRVYIDGFKNLKEAECDFDESRLTSVVIGQNGSGKSNLIEALVTIFRFADLNRGEPKFRYEVDYQIGGKKIRLSNLSGKPTINSDGDVMSRKAFEDSKRDVFPDLVFGYYSGSSRRLEQLFDSHQRRYYDAVKLEEDEHKCYEALLERRLFYCRPVHGAFALAASFGFPSDNVSRLLKDKLRISGFHSALALLREPWFAKSRSNKATAEEFWRAKGPAGRCASHLKEVAFHPVSLTDSPIDDYRSSSSNESQYALFLRGGCALRSFADQYSDDGDMFYALENLDISDLIRDFHVWVKRPSDDSGDVGFSDLSDGERQLLMVLGLIRIARGKRALFLLDEPDTHLNPHWQHSYLDLIREWTEVAADSASECHIVMTSHNPLTIAALEKEEVRVMSVGDDGKVCIAPPYADPKGLGFTSTLTEIFGLPTSLDAETQRTIDDRNQLTQIVKRTEGQERHLIEINDKLNRLGFLFEDREPLYNEFLQAWKDVRYADKPPLTPYQVEQRRRAMKELIQKLQAKQGGAA